VTEIEEAADKVETEEVAVARDKVVETAPVDNRVEEDKNQCAG
jgi:hypothetical protein